MSYVQALGLSSILALATLAGCVGSEAGDAASAADPTQPIKLEDGEVIVSGVVVDDQLAPIAGALLQLDESAPVTTDVAGAFTIAPVTPGEHTIIVQALGHESMARRVTVPSEGLTGLTFTLAPLPVETPYTEVAILRGFSICDVSVFLLITTVDGYIGQCPLGEPVRNVEMDVADSWRYGVLEMDWLTADSFAFYTSKDGNCLTNDPCWGALMGPPPLRMYAAPQDPELAKRYRLVTSSEGAMYPEEGFHMIITALYAGMFQREMNNTLGPQCQQDVDFYIGCPGIGTTLGVAFTYYVSVFHFERPSDPEKYSAVPDN